MGISLNANSCALGSTVRSFGRSDLALSIASFTFTFAISVFTSVSNSTTIKLKTYADKLQDKFEELSEITRAEIIGAPEREIQVNIDPYKMQAAKVSFMDIENAISRENRDITGGLIEVGNMKRTIKIKGQFTSALNLQNIIVRSSARGASVYLKDIAQLNIIQGMIQIC